MKEILLSAAFASTLLMMFVPTSAFADIYYPNNPPHCAKGYTWAKGRCNSIIVTSPEKTGEKVPSEEPATWEQKIEGQIKSVDPAKKEVTLADGTKLVIPEGEKLPPNVKAGATVTANYIEKAGKKVLTGIEVQPSASPRTAPPSGSPKR